MRTKASIIASSHFTNRRYTASSRHLLTPLRLSQRTWRHRFAAPAVRLVRFALKRARDFADFWFCELDKFCGGFIFCILFVFSLLPIASVQAMLIWNETFSDVIKQRVRVSECIQEIIE